MRNNGIDNLQEILTKLSIKNYSISIVVSPYLYNYISKSVKDITIQNNYNFNYFCNCQIFIDRALKDYEYKIIRKKIQK